VGDVGTGSADGPFVDVRKEVRLALVMYGGVSLAIYMNGVAQELFHLVRATAPRDLSSGRRSEPLIPDARLGGTERVYRKLGQALESLAQDRTAPVAGVAPETDISTRFVVDVLSGSSAGGINAVFLAKALANDQGLEHLKGLWLDEGDISRLLNDSRSTVPGIRREHPPESLLNSGRMYWELLQAFEDMEPSGPAGRSKEECASPYVEELDLYVTTTDLRGVTLPLQISNGVAFERRYRNVFHFVYGTSDATGEDRNDFHAGNNPMLAFAARCTSAFPWAFRPMLFEDMAEALRKSDRFRSVDLDQHPWKQFYSDYLPARPGDGPPPQGAGAEPDVPSPERDLRFLKRPFADGGALDNKPFTWTTGSLQRRRADVPVDRKLIYVEPDPGHPELEVTEQGRPDALTNFELQGVSLPRQESIRDDLQAVLDRNRTIQRVARALLGVQEDQRRAPPGSADPPGAGATGGDGGEPPAVPWSERGVEEDVEAMGLGYGGYHRLKVATVTDDMASLVAAVEGFDEDSDEGAAIRYLIRAWRDANYSHYRGVKPKTFNAFLVQYDLSHRLRRLNFLRTTVDELYAVDVPIHGEDYRTELLALKEGFSDIFTGLRYLGRRLRRKHVPPLAPLLEELHLGIGDLVAILGQPDEASRSRAAGDLYLSRKAAFDRFAGALADFLADGVPPDRDGGGRPAPPAYGTRLAAHDLETQLDVSGAATPGGVAARATLRWYFEEFDQYDMVAFPMLYGSDAGETDVVEIVRISPEDATSIVDERGSGFQKRKTRGYRYSHFGAFLDRQWRSNDILFGRLDAAECLIGALLPPGHPDRDALLRSAQRAIIVEDLEPEELVRSLGDTTGLSDEDFVKRFAERWSVPDQLPARTALPIAARGADVMGAVLKGISNERGALEKPVGWLSRMASLAAGIVAVSLPGGAPHLVFQHLAPLLVGFQVLLLVLGILFHSAPVIHIAEITLLVSGLSWALVYVLSSVMRGGRWPVRLLKGLAVVIGVGAVALLIALALAAVGHDWNHPSRYWHDLVRLYHHLRPAPSPSAGPG